jgi:hypothetical protein
VTCNYQYLGWVLTWNYLKQGFWRKIFVFGWKITDFENCLRDNFSKHGYIWIIFCMWLVIISILDGFLHGNIFQLYHGKNKLIFNEMMMRSALYYTNTLSWIFIVLTYWNNSLWIDLSPHLDTLSWFWANQSLPFLLNAACLARSNTYQFNSLWFDPIRTRTQDLPHSRRAHYPLHQRCSVEPQIYLTWGEHTNHYTTDVVLNPRSTSLEESILTITPPM